MQIRRQLIDVEQRHGAADGLLGAAERIAVERREQARNIERRRGRHRQRQAAGTGNEVGEQSFDSVSVWPGSSGLTVRRAKIWVAGCTCNAYCRSSAKPPGPLTVDRDGAGADAGRADWHAQAPRFLASSVMVFEACDSSSGPSASSAT